MGVRLEESGDEGVIVLSSIHDDFLRCNGEYWPEIGERIRVRRYIYRSPNDEVRLTSRESMESQVERTGRLLLIPSRERLGRKREIYKKCRAERDRHGAKNYHDQRGTRNLYHSIRIFL